MPEGTLTGVIINIGDNTLMGRIAALAMQTNNEQTPINRELEAFIHIISGIAMFLGITFLSINIAAKMPIISNIVFVIGIIVANVPEGLITTVTVCLTLTANRMHSKMVLVKNLEGVETLGSTSCICSDKTGTLTQNIMTVAQIVYGGADGFSIEDCESSFSKAGKSYDENNGSFKALCMCASLCNVAVFDEKSKFETNEDNEFLLDGAGNRKPIDFYSMREQGDGSTIREVAWKPVGNASEAAMIKFIHPLQNVDEVRAAAPPEAVIPFNSKNKYQVHVHVNAAFNAAGVTAATAAPEIISGNKGNRMIYMKGAPERILTRCDKQMVDGKIVTMTEADRTKIDDLNMKLAENGLRVLAFAQAEVSTKGFPPGYKYTAEPDGFCSPNFPIGDFNQKYDTKDPLSPQSKTGLVYIGMMALIDPPRPAVPPAVSKCKTAGIKVIMVTGDHPVTAQAIAYKVGILWSKTEGDMKKENDAASLSPGDDGYQDPASAQAITVPGHLISIDDPEEKWDQILEHPQIVFARTSPQQKLIIVENCQRLGHIVAVTGDGVNDSPALKKADIGVAMGIMGSEVSKNAADMILLDDNFASIVAGVEEGRLIFDNLKKSICYTLSSNIPEISPFISQTLMSIPLPLSTVLILAVDLGTDMVPAISMAYETAEADIMKRPPRNAKTDRLVTKKLINLAYLQIGIMQAMAGFYVYMVVLNDYGFGPHLIVGLGKNDYWGVQNMYCQFEGGQYVNTKGVVDPITKDPASVGPDQKYPLWDRGDGGYVKKCAYPQKNFDGSGGNVASADRENVDKYFTATGGKSQVTFEAIQAVEAQNYFEYIPWRGRMSPFWNANWLSWDISELEGNPGYLGSDATKQLFFTATPSGVWSIVGAQPAMDKKSGSDADYTGYSGHMDVYKAFDLEKLSYKNGGTPTGSMSTSKLYSKALFCNGQTRTTDHAGEALGAAVDPCTAILELVKDKPFMPRWCASKCGYTTHATSDCQATKDTTHTNMCANIANRMVQKEALHHAQGAYFVSIVVVQWADLLLCKTRWLSLRTQGMSNSVMNFGLFFETLLGGWLCYCTPINTGLGTRNIRFTHWLPGIPWSCLIFTYDEIRKYLMRTTSPESVDKNTGQITRLKGWIERNTYY